MRLKFVGEDGSMGLRHGTTYAVRFEPRNAPIGGPFTAIFLGGVRCPYANDIAFWKNWEPPSIDDDHISRAKQEAIREVWDFAWKEGYDACKEGKQRRSPYAKRRELRPSGEHGSNPDRQH